MSKNQVTFGWAVRTAFTSVNRLHPKLSPKKQTEVVTRAMNIGLTEGTIRFKNPGEVRQLLRQLH